MRHDLTNIRCMSTLVNSGFGFNFCWGVYQEHYIQENIFAGATLSQISWVGGIGASSVFITGPFQASMVRRFGLRPVIASGALISATGMILASFAVSLWQLYLTQVNILNNEGCSKFVPLRDTNYRNC